jgi:glycosyltransferase involved in cell wall biosynthesis
MRERGHTCALAAQEHSKIMAACRDAGFETFIISEKPLGFLFSLIRITGWFRSWRPDVVNTHSSKDGWIGGIGARLAGVPLLIRSRHIEVDYPNRWRSRIAFGGLPHHVITTSEQIRERLVRELGLEPVHVTCLSTGIDLAAFDQGPDGDPEPFKRKPGVPALGMISVLRSWKGHHYFLEALALLRDRGIDFTAIIAGEGPRRSFIERKREELRLTEQVQLIGHREDVPQLLRALDVLVLPSTGHEGIPQIILQAHATACPVVASRAGGIPEVVQDGVTGRLVEPAEVPALAAALQEAIVNSEESQAMARRGRERVEKEHTLEVMCRKLESLYASKLPHPE